MEKKFNGFIVIPKAGYSALIAITRYTACGHESVLKAWFVYYFY